MNAPKCAQLASISREVLAPELAKYASGYDVTSAIVDGSSEGLLHVVLRARDHGDALVLRVEQGLDTPLRLVLLALADDDVLPGACLARDRDRLARVLKPCLDVISRVRIVSHRPHRRAVLAVHGLSKRSTRTVFVKLLRRGAYRRAKKNFSRLPQTPGGLHLVRPESWSDDLCCFALSAAPGRSVHERLSQGELVDWSTVTRALTLLHAAPAPHDVPTYGWIEEKAAAQKLLRRALDTTPALSEVLAVVEATAVPELPLRRWLHRDLHDKQVFLDGNQVTLIDVEGASGGDPRSDLVNLEEHRRLRTLQTNRSGRGSPGLRLCDRDPYVRLARGLIRARLAGVYGRRPGWQRLALQLGNESMELLT